MPPQLRTNCEIETRASYAAALNDIHRDTINTADSGYRMNVVLGGHPSPVGISLRKMSSNYKLTEVDGDLFSAPKTHSFAHCVAADFGMGAGIAVKFKQIYGQIDLLLSQGVRSGGVAVLKDDDRYIYYLVTKPQSWDKPTYDSLRSSLCAMRDHMRTNKVDKLAIPRIGCGIDGLEWDKVTNEINSIFSNEHLEIVVYNFVPK